MAIQNRRGKYADFDPSKMKPGEWAVVQTGDESTQDGAAVYIAFEAGKVKRMATADEMNSANNEARQYAEDAQNSKEEASRLYTEANNKANSASASAQDAAQSANNASRTLATAEETINTTKSNAIEEFEKEATQIKNTAMEVINKKASDIVKITTDADKIAKEALDKAGNLENEVAAAGNDVDELKKKDKAMELIIEGKVDGAYVENGYLYLTSNNEVVAGPLGPFSGTGGGGGGGTGGNNAELTVSNVTGWLSKTIATGDTCEVKINWSSTEDDMPTGNGSLKITVNGIVKGILDVTQGEVTVDISKYLTVGSNVVKINVADVYDNNRTINFSVTSIALSISSTFDAGVPYQGAVSFPYTPVGAIQKTVHFLLDGKEIGNNVTSVSNRQMSFTIPQQKHGGHTLEVYFDCDINGQIVKSNTLYYEIICLEALNDTPIIVSSFNTKAVKQYTTLHVDYTIYDPNALTAVVELYVNEKLASKQTVDRTQQSFAYRADEVGTLTIKIVSGNVSKTVNVTVEESDIHVDAETEYLKLFLSSAGRSNNEDHPEQWQYEDIHAVFSNFNFTSDGWQSDEEGITVLRVAGDARVSIPYKPFSNDFRASGKTIEFEIATRDVMNYDSEIISCMSGGRGFSLTAQKATLKSEQSEIFTQYKENEHIRIAFTVEKRVENRLVYCYINGIMSGVIRYANDDDFAQADPVDISIGSNDCTVDVYAIRIYDNDLTRYQILNNWIADTQTVDDMLNRYQRNSVYDEYGNIIIARLPADLPYIIFECEELPQYKGDKKQVDVSYIDPVTPSKSFTCTMELNVQGTSSQYYARKNYKGKCKTGFTMNNGTVSSKYKLRNDSIPTNTFTFKADVASSEGANNVELARLYNDICPYKTPAQKENSAIRQGIDGFPIVAFWSNPSSGETSFLGKYNFNNDKGTAEIYGFVDGDESWEIRNNTGARVLWKSADFSGTDWLNDFEARFPDTDPPYADPTQLAEFASFLVSTDTTAATGNTLESPVLYEDVTYTNDTAEYRLAKFKAEIGNYVELKSAQFYYLFTEGFLMVDSRAKNMFPSPMGGSVA